MPVSGLIDDSRLCAICAKWIDTETNMPLASAAALAGLGKSAWSEFRKQQNAEEAIIRLATRRGLPVVATRATMLARCTLLTNGLFFVRCMDVQQIAGLNEYWRLQVESWKPDVQIDLPSPLVVKWQLIRGMKFTVPPGIGNIRLFGVGI